MEGRLFITIKNKVVYDSGSSHGITLSKLAVRKLQRLGLNINENGWNFDEHEYIARHDQRLVQVVEELGNLVNTKYSNLKIKVISGNVYKIEENNGSEIVVVPDHLHGFITIK